MKLLPKSRSVFNRSLAKTETNAKENCTEKDKRRSDVKEQELNLSVVGLLLEFPLYVF